MAGKLLPPAVPPPMLALSREAVVLIVLLPPKLLLLLDAAPCRTPLVLPPPTGSIAGPRGGCVLGTRLRAAADSAIVPVRPASAHLRRYGAGELEISLGRRHVAS